MAYFIYWPMPVLSSQRIVTCGCNDLAQQVWFLEWTRFAILHGRNPFFSGWLNYPFGVNLADNTSMPILGLVAFPITSAFGPIAAFNLLVRLAFVLSGLSMFLVLRSFVRSNLACFLGGLVYGFSPYLIGQGHGHLNLLFVPLPPVILALLVELYVRERWRVRTTGLVLGLCCVVQFLISTEVFASTAILGAIGTAIAAVWHRDRTREVYSRVVSGLVWALGVFIVFAGYPIWFVLAGPGHITGVAQPLAGLWEIHADLFGPILPTVDQRFGPARLIAIGTSFSVGNVPENGIYLGIPALVAFVVSVVALRKVVLVRIAAVMAGIAFVLALGPSLEIDNHDTHIPLPFDLFRHVPLLQSQVPGRYSLFVQLFVVVVLVVGLDRAMSFAHRQRRYALSLVVACVVVLIPLVPRIPFPTPPVSLPSYFADAQLDAIAPGSVLLSYPYPVNPDNVAMLWQANVAMRFKLLGDYAITSDANGDGTTAPPLLAPGVMQKVLEGAMYGAKSPLGLPPKLTRATIVAMRRFLTRYEVGTVALDPIGVNPSLAISYLSAVLGPPIKIQGTDLWYRVKERLGS